MCWDALNWGPLSMLLTWGRVGGDWELCANDHRSNHLINNYLQEPITKAEEGLPTSDFWLPTSVFRLPTYDFRLLTSDFRLQTSDFRLDKVRTPDFWFLTVQTQSWMVRPSNLPLPTSHFPLPTSDFRLLTSNLRFATSDFQLPTSDLTLLFGSIAARSTRQVLILKVKAQWKGQLYHSRRPQKGTIKLALEKATKHKANPATDEVRLENRNHGLAWSQSSNNTTVQTLSIFF